VDQMDVTAVAGGQVFSMALARGGQVLVSGSLVGSSDFQAAALPDAFEVIAQLLGAPNQFSFVNFQTALKRRHLPSVDPLPRLATLQRAATTLSLSAVTEGASRWWSPE
jgi:hypothetical protein